jgi:DNA-binding XRE family transcriptional regulator
LSVNILANNIRAARKKWGMSQEVMGKLFGCDQASISFWERGLIVPSGVGMTSIAAAFGCRREDLATEGLFIPDQPVGLPVFHVNIAPLPTEKAG